jgi:hypothetical protein
MDSMTAWADRRTDRQRDGTAGQRDGMSGQTDPATGGGGWGARRSVSGVK